MYRILFRVSVCFGIGIVYAGCLHDLPAKGHHIEQHTNDYGQQKQNTTTRGLVLGFLPFGAIARTGRAPRQSTCEPIITTNVCSVGTPYVTLIVILNYKGLQKGFVQRVSLNVTLNCDP